MASTLSEPRPIHPGEILEEWLAERRITGAEVAARADLSEKAVSQIINGHAPVTTETSLRLEHVTGIPAATWSKLQSYFDEATGRSRRRERLSEEVGFLAEVPVGHLRKLGIVTAGGRDKVGQLEEVLAFFGVEDTTAWNRVWNDPKVAFRRSLAGSKKPVAVATWLRLGQLEAETVRTAPFDATGLRAALPEIRTLTAGDVSEAAHEAQRLVAQSGVALVYVPEVPGSRCSGATSWLSPDRVLVQLSLRYRSDDQFFFSMFHELGHVLLHNKRTAFLDGLDEGVQEDAELEAQANEFAANHLIPARDWARARHLRRLAEIQAFSAELTIAPGIVVGRLQREGLLPYNQGNGLKRRLQFEGDRRS